ncbi:MAG: IMP cyclohydrolase [Deltaproteobacteria bacterium SM23_61]|nr:MAG: IMP cyclohydrolase [Deltaproteobacteria bacterium SM23_61]
MGKIQRAVISLSDKSGIVDFAKEIQSFGVEILSTGGTAKTLRENGLKIMDVSDYTGFPEMLDGRVKTLHPKIHGGLLGIRDNPEHAKKMKEHGIVPIDMVVVNLYPFEATIAKPNCTLEEAIENIDIGGPSMLRASAKNYPYVTVIVDPADYQPVLNEMKKSGGAVSKETNFRLAKKVYALTAKYDRAISEYLAKK